MFPAAVTENLTLFFGIRAFLVILSGLRVAARTVHPWFLTELFTQVSQVRNKDLNDLLKIYAYEE